MDYFWSFDLSKSSRKMSFCAWNTFRSKLREEIAWKVKIIIMLRVKEIWNHLPSQTNDTKNRIKIFQKNVYFFFALATAFFAVFFVSSFAVFSTALLISAFVIFLSPWEWIICWIPKNSKKYSVLKLYIFIRVPNFVRNVKKDCFSCKPFPFSYTCVSFRSKRLFLCINTSWKVPRSKKAKRK